MTSDLCFTTDEKYICLMNDNQHPTITVKLKPYLQEYLVCSLNTNRASRTNLIGKLLKPLLEIRPVDQPPELARGSDYITFVLPYYEDLWIKSNLWVSPKNQEIFESYLEWHFKELFFHYMHDKVRFYGSFKKCILQFCFDHNITFSYLNYELLKKDYYRKRKRKISEKSCSGFVSEMSPDCHCVFLHKN
jgi:hypothetical protein